MPDDPMYQEALGAIEKGERNRARDLLTRYLRIHPDEAPAWVSMSAVVETPREIIYCLQEALKRDPGNQAARQGLALYGARPPEAASGRAWVKRRWQTDYNQEPADPARPRLAGWKIAGPVGGALLVLVLIILGLGLLNKRPAPVVYSPPETEGPTSTYLPSTTPVVRSPTPTFVGPTPLWMLLKATYTPTPLYVNTPHPRTEAYRTGIRDLQRDNWPGVINNMEQVLTVEPSSPDVLYYIGEAYRLQKNYSAALAAFEEAIKVEPSFAPAYLGRARVTRMLNPNADVSADLDKAISLDPGLADAYYEKADLQLTQNQPDLALQTIDAVAQFQPDSPWLPYYRGRAYLAQGQASQALAQAQSAYDQNLTYLPAYLLLGEALQANDRYADSIKPLNTYVLFEPQSAQAWVLLGLAYAAGRQDDQALAALTQAIKIDNQDANAYLQRGLVYLDQQDGKDAYNDLAQAVQLDSKSFAARIGLGRAYLILGFSSEAYTQVNAAATLAASDSDRASLYYWRAFILEAEGNQAAAAKDWNALLELPSDAVPADWAAQARQSLASTPTVTGTVTPTPTNTRIPTRTLTPTRTPLPPTSTYHSP